MRSKLKKGQSGLMIGGAGALGQALISLCLAFGCTVFTTVSSIEKKTMLLRLFPQLKEDYIAYSDPCSLYTKIMVKTEKQGCDVIAMDCVKCLGFFLDLTKYQMLENKNIGMFCLELDRTYRAVDLSNIFRPEYAKDKQLLRHYVGEGIAAGVVTPLTRVVYSPSAVTRAFRLLATRRHAGRVLLKLRDPSIMSQGLSVSPRLTHSPDDVIVVVCDESDLGIMLADKLIERGAKKILLQIKSSKISGFVQTMFLSWSKREDSVKLSSENILTEQGCANLMKNAMKFGKVKAVFIILDGEGSDNGEKDDFIIAYNKKCSVVLNLDLATRNYADIRHFAIIANVDDNVSDRYFYSVMERVCELRNEMGFPALVMRYQSMQKVNNSETIFDRKEPQSLRTFFKAMEISLKMNYKKVITFSIKDDNTDFNKKIAAILGVADIAQLQNESTLLELNVNNISLNELRAAINSSFHIDHPLEKISGVTVTSLQELSKIKIKQTTDFECGLFAFYKGVDSEQNYLMKHLYTTLSTKRTDKINVESPLVIFIPGFEGRCEIFKTIAGTLKIPAIAAEIGPDVEGESIPNVAENVKKLIKPMLKMNSKFIILGYSFGVNIALELAAILEREGRHGVVYCLDSSPDAIRCHLNAYLGKLSDDELQNKTLTHMFNLITGYENKDILHEINKFNTFEEKIGIVLKRLKRFVSYSEQYTKHVLVSAYKRIKLAKEYKPQIKLESQLILLKGIAHPNSESLTVDYNLSQYTKEPVEIFQLNSDHGLCHRDLRVSNIINGQIC